MTTGTILDKILDAKRAELERAQRETPLAELQERVKGAPFPLNLSGALWGESIRLIAEVKKASPSKGVIVVDYDPAARAWADGASGAGWVPVLTEVDPLGGSLAPLEAVKAVVGPQGLPVLRKDFIFDPYQLFESRAAGADAVLLIVAALSGDQLRELLAAAQTIWLQALVEVHDEAELETALGAGAEIIGVNHRALRTFGVGKWPSPQRRTCVAARGRLGGERGAGRRARRAGPRGWSGPATPAR